jgi:hypothetical protein
VWGGWLSKKPFQKELAMHRLTFDPGQRRVLLLFLYIKVNLCVCVFVCVSGIEIHTVGPILTKFGMGA